MYKAKSCWEVENPKRKPAFEHQAEEELMNSENDLAEN
jgi:hypothetical protein